MPLPFFYEENLNNEFSFSVSEETSKHIIQVLRMKAGEQLQLTNGKGKVLIAEIITEHKKSTKVKVITASYIKHRTLNITIAISLIKNSTRFEWFLEKATEIGVSAIIPLICERTEKQNFRRERMKNILISAMLQSQQAWLPELYQPTKLSDVIKTNSQQKYIAHCIDEEKTSFTNQLINESTDQLILIGPEGDFTKHEIDLAVENNFIPVSLGSTRLRTETAGVVAAVLLNNNH
jgi:16S rRNA (uracil1498-N3)-methyltransferase